MIISCRIAICGHTFCHYCIAECLIRKKECPSCRKNIRKKPLKNFLVIDNTVKMIINQKLQSGNKDEYEKWQERTQKYHEWIDSHKVLSVSPGDKLDVCDTESIWCVAVVELVIHTPNRK